MSGGKNSKLGKFELSGLVGFLRARFPQATAAHVGCLIGAPASTVDKWLRGEARPGVENFAKLAAALGPALLAASIPQVPDWLERSCADEQKRDIEQQIAELKKGL